MKIYRCEKCGKMIVMLKDCPCPTFCCGEEMKEVIAGTTDAAVEKHVPVCEVKDNTVCVTVGAVEHPMLEAHYIEWIVLETKGGYQFKALKPGDAPKACFAVAEGDEAVAAYAYCNLHSLWKA